jgi:hypothetical protein
MERPAPLELGTSIPEWPTAQVGEGRRRTRLGPHKRPNTSDSSCVPFPHHLIQTIENMNSPLVC